MAAASPTTVHIPSGGDTVEALHFAVPGAPLVIFCHGFPGFFKHVDLAEQLFASGYGVLLLKYRGVDGSTGHFSFTNAIEDVIAAARHAATLGIAPGRIAAFGYSYGAFASIGAALETGLLRSICVLSPVTDMPRAARNEFENIYDLMLDAPKVIRVRSVAELVASFAEAWCRYHVPERVRTLRGVPLSIIDGQFPGRSDAGQASLLYACASEPKELHWLPTADHYFQRPEDRQQIGSLMRDFYGRTLTDAGRESRMAG